MIKPEFFTDDHLCSIDIEASYLFSGIWCFADDYGAIFYSERSIMGDIYCKRESIKWKKVEKWINDLIKIGCLIKCSYCGRDYLVVTNWDDHQTINRPSTRTYLEKSITYKARLMYDEMRDSGQETVEAPELFLSVSLTNIKEKENKKENKKAVCRVIENPTIEDVKNYFKENGYNEQSAIKFFDSYSVNNWFDSRGNPVLNWKQKAINVWFKDENKITYQQEQTSSPYRRV